jgi:hypothetical protein
LTNPLYSSVVKGGTVGGLIGLAGGLAGVLLASRRYHTIRNLTLPMKSFLVTSSGTFTGIIAADHASRGYEKDHNAAYQWYKNHEERLRADEMRALSFTDRAVAFARREKYKIISATWIASMIGSFVIVGRNPHLSGQQKLVQARVYAQGLTLGVLCASAAFEISDQRHGRGLLDLKKASASTEAPARKDSQSQTDLWKDLVAAEEQRLKSKQQSLYKHHQKQQDASTGNKDQAADPEEATASTSSPRRRKTRSLSEISDDNQTNEKKNAEFENKTKSS